MRDYYAILGLDRDAHEDQIKQSYRKLALRHHPDRGGNAEDFKRISEAYAVLSDPQKKKQYDLTGGISDMDLSMNFMDLFHTFFQHQFATTARQVHDRKLVAYVTLEEVMRGTVIAVRIKRKVLTARPLECRFCHGQGHIQREKNMGLFMTILTTMCEHCRGVGVVSKESDYILQEDILRIRIEPGIPNGREIRLQGKGDEMPGMTVGDVLLTVMYKDHPVYRIHHTHRLDLATDMTLTLGEFLCGFERYLTLLDDTVMRIYLKPGDLLNGKSLESSLQKRIPFYGLRDKEHRGNLYLFFRVILPERLEADKIRHFFPDAKTIEGKQARHVDIDLREL